MFYNWLIVKPNGQKADVHVLENNFFKLLSSLFIDNVSPGQGIKPPYREREKLSLSAFFGTEDN